MGSLPSFYYYPIFLQEERSHQGNLSRRRAAKVVIAFLSSATHLPAKASEGNFFPLLCKLSLRETPARAHRLLACLAWLAAVILPCAQQVSWLACRRSRREVMNIS